VNLGLALRIGLAAGFPTAVVFLAAEYARQRGELIRMAHQLNMTQRERLVASRLGRQALRESLRSAAVAGLCSFGGAAAPLAAAGEIPGNGLTAVFFAVLCLGALGAGIGYTTLSCRLCWALALTTAGGLLAWVGAILQIV
jgi:VIT1/CCC1 family predicted Fe2+/Mn2+ transporter